MMYYSVHTIVKASKLYLWEAMLQILTKPEAVIPRVYEYSIIEHTNNEVLRRIDLDGELLTEKVIAHMSSFRIVSSLMDNPLYYGETTYQIVVPEQENLQLKKSTLVVVWARRMHPGIIEAPILDKQDFLEQTLHKIKQTAESLMEV